MTTDTIFNAAGDDKSTGAPPAKTEDKGLLDALVGETQKYKSAEELAKAYVNADSFIEQLKEENRKLREQTAAAKTIDEVLERINTKEKKPEDTTANALSKEDVALLVEQTLTGLETAKTKEANLRKADQLMKEKFGEKAANVFKQKAATPELQRVYMELASVDPSQFVSLFAGDAPPATAAVDTSTVSAAALPSATSNRATVEGTKEWASKIRKENPSLYWSADFQNKLQQAVIKNPSLYFGN